jgi:hypothetical protein
MGAQARADPKNVTYGRKHSSFLSNFSQLKMTNVGRNMWCAYTSEAEEFNV